MKKRFDSEVVDRATALRTRRRSSVFALVLLVAAAPVIVTGCRIAESRRLVAASLAYQQPGSEPALLVVGDSTAEGTGALDSRNSIAGRLGTRWPTAAIVNRSRDGAKLVEVAEQIRSAPVRPYRLVLIMAGGNDILGGTSKTELATSLREVFKAAKALDAPVIFMGAGNIGTAPMFPWPVSWWLSRRARSAQSVFDSVSAAENVARVNLFYEPAADPFLTDPDRYYARDGLHPSDSGYGLWWQALRETLDEIQRAHDPQ